MSRAGASSSPGWCRGSASARSCTGLLPVWDWAGFVGNTSGAVFVEVEGTKSSLADFAQRLRAEAPPLARIAAIDRADLPVTGEAGFTIVASTVNDQGAQPFVSPDTASCDSCLQELFDPKNRRYRHPFITCTDCGPRFTIIRDLPYDRPATTMAGFAMCAACSREYRDPADRRFHAQPIACRECGPAAVVRDGEASVSKVPTLLSVRRSGRSWPEKSLLSKELAAITWRAGPMIRVCWLGYASARTATRSRSRSSCVTSRRRAVWCSSMTRNAPCW